MSRFQSGRTWPGPGESGQPSPCASQWVPERQGKMGSGLVLGIDVGSTTVKAVVVDPDTPAILWSDYQRHETRHGAQSLELLAAIGGASPDVPRAPTPP